MLTCLSRNDPRIKDGMYAGLYRWWNCLEKANIAYNHFKRGVVVVGSLKIYNSDFTATYSFEYNPPFEFHAWLKDGQLIYDYGLLGSMELGNQLKDECGPIIDRKPEYLNFQKPHNWTIYNAKTAITHAPSSCIHKK